MTRLTKKETASVALDQLCAAKSAVHAARVAMELAGGNGAMQNALKAMELKLVDMQWQSIGTASKGSAAKSRALARAYIEATDALRADREVA